MVRKGIVALLAFAVCGPALAQDEAPYIEAGKRMAEANCSNCHNIEPGGAFKMYPPTFQAMAIYMDPDVMRLKIMYPDHAVLMPEFNNILFRENLDDLVGYIQSLED